MFISMDMCFSLACETDALSHLTKYFIYIPPENIKEP